jgi:iron complex transport system ATP-binding protein
MTTAPLLSVTACSVDLGGQTVLRDVALTVEPGEWVSVIGPNGSGKTTLLRAVSGAVKARGDLRLKGRDLRDWGARERARVLAFVRQHATVPFDFSVRDLVLLGRAPHRGWLSAFRDVDRAAVDRALDAVDLSSFASRSMQSMSGGEVQRAFLAQALAQDADLLLLDEPTTHLDVHYQYRLLDAVRAHVHRGKSVVAVVHDLESAARYADRMLVLKDGRVDAFGPPADVLTPACIASVFGMTADVRRDGDTLRVDYRQPVRSEDGGN